MRSPFQRLVVPGIIALGLILTTCQEPRPAPPRSPDRLPPTARIVALSFVDPLHGWVVAADCPPGETAPASACRALVYRTDDGGRTWAPGGRASISPRALQFADPTAGWLTGSIGQQCGANPCPNVVMRSTDGGRTWERTTTTSAALLAERFVSPADGWVLGQLCAEPARCRAILISTQSGGATWTNQELPLSGHGFVLDRVSARDGWVGGIDQGQVRLLSTSDGGAHWSSHALSVRADSLSVDFRSPAEGWLASLAWEPTGGRLAIFRTEDGAATWQQISELAIPAGSTSSGGGQITFASAEDGWLVTPGGALLVSHDGGRHWTSAPGAVGPVAAAQLLDRVHGWAAGGQTVWQTADSGQTWEAPGTSADLGGSGESSRGTVAPQRHGAPALTSSSRPS